jgi:hypothetical protein
VGTKSIECNQNLDNRLSSHRSTYAPLTLINAIIFENSAEVTIFESFLKLALGPFSIGLAEKLEQYQVDFEKNPELKSDSFVLEDFISGIIMAQFNQVNHICKICDPSLVQEYNAITKLRVSSSSPSPSAAAAAAAAPHN